ncbi:MAG: S-layer homology domain-containing protein [Thermoleophilia bacterium]
MIRRIVVLSLVLALLLFSSLVGYSAALPDAASPVPNGLSFSATEIDTSDDPDTSSFTDVPATHPYRAQIATLASQGIISGYGDGRFGPDNVLTRQQFAKMIVRALDLPVTTNDICPFGDVESNLDPNDPLYPNHYVAVCAAEGITIGKTPSHFAPYENIARQQLITMVTRAAILPEPPFDHVPSFGSEQFGLQEHYLNACKADYHGLLSGIEGLDSEFNFMAPATRGEVCVLLYNLMNSELAAEGRGVRDAIKETLEPDSFNFMVIRVYYSGSWAGAGIMPINAGIDPSRFLLSKDTDGWTVVDYGTDQTVEDWIAQGAPEDLAEWLDSGLWCDEGAVG